MARSSTFGDEVPDLGEPFPGEIELQPFNDIEAQIVNDGAILGGEICPTE